MTESQKAYHLAMIAALDALIISLEARMKHAMRFTLNTSMQMEAALCSCQIDALKAHSRQLNDKRAVL